MLSTRTMLSLSGALTLLLLAGCASLPDDLGQEYSEGWQSPETTFLGTLIAEAPEAADPGQSGVELLSHPEEAFRTRFYIANLAEESLDLQYYLWKDDLAGALLLWSALDAADRGVRVRFLIDDIYHAGRDDLYALMDTHENFEVRVFNPMANRGLARYLNYAANREQLNRRMHNKIFLADNAVAVLGGRNIGNDYFGIDANANFFDLDVLTTGAGAREAGAAFDEYWNSRFAVPIRVLHDAPFTPADLSQARSRLDDAVAKIGEVPYTIDLESEDLEERLREWSAQLSWVNAHVVVDPLVMPVGAMADAGVQVFRLIRRLREELNDQIFRQLEEAMTVSVASLDNMFRNAGLPTERVLDQVRRGYSGQGGPLTPLSFSTRSDELSPDTMRANRLLNQMGCR